MRFILLISIVVVIVIVVLALRKKDDKSHRPWDPKAIYGNGHRHYDHSYREGGTIPEWLEDEPIDVVYSWIDGNHDVTYQNLDKWINIERVNMSVNRIRDNGELKYSILSVLKHAPWVRNIYVVTSNHREPDWFYEYKNNIMSNVTFIDDSEIMPDDAIPTFNSRAKEVSICFIPGLSEYYWYFNDDIMLGDYVHKSDLFHPDGKVKMFVENHRILDSLGEYRKRGVLMTDDLLDERFGVYLDPETIEDIQKLDPTWSSNEFETPFNPNLANAIRDVSTFRSDEFRPVSNTSVSNATESSLADSKRVKQPNRTDLKQTNASTLSNRIQEIETGKIHPCVITYKHDSKHKQNRAKHVEHFRDVSHSIRSQNTSDSRFESIETDENRVKLHSKCSKSRRTQNAKRLETHRTQNAKHLEIEFEPTRNASKRIEHKCQNASNATFGQIETGQIASNAKLNGLKNRKRLRRVSRHVAHIHIKSEDLYRWKHYEPWLIRTVKSRFRRPHNISDNVLFNIWWMYHRGLANFAYLKSMHISIGSDANRNKRGFETALKVRPKMICLNDDIGDVDSVLEAKIQEGMQNYMMTLVS